MKINRRNRPAVWLAAAAAAAGVGIGAAGIASAATGSTGSTGTATTNTSVIAPAAGNPQQAPQVDPASLPNGPGETVLTGSNATSVEAAVKAAEPTATVIRLETDSGGHAFEAHVKLADGTVKTLYFNSSFAADGSDTGFGPGGPGGHGGDHDGDGPNGAPQQGAAPQAPAITGNTTATSGN